MTDIPLYKILRDQTRQKILSLIGEKGNVSYTDILVSLNLSTGKLNYHLKILAPFIVKDNGGYALNETGENAYRVLKNFDKDEKNGKNSIYRPLGWLLLSISLMLLLVSFPAAGLFGLESNAAVYLIVGTIGLTVMLTSVFFFYSSGITRISILEMVGIVVMALIIGSIGSLFQAKLYGSPLFHVSTALFSIPSFLGAIIFFSSYVNWALDNNRRWFMASLSIISFSIFYIIPLIYYLYVGLGNYSEVDINFPLPAMFLVVTAISYKARMLNYNSMSDSYS